MADAQPAGSSDAASVTRGEARPTVDLTPVAGTAGPVAPAAGPAAYPAIPGYEILGVLGRGGMGVVYQARQTGLNRLVALKMILAGVHASPKELARFRSEAEAVARLQHPGIVQIHEIGTHAGQPFFSLEYVDGGSLERASHATPQPARLAAQLVATLARAMHAAHQQGIIHRDLKPANVLLKIDKETARTTRHRPEPSSARRATWPPSRHWAR